jgi:hypothetical protein
MNEQEKKPRNPSAFPEPYVNDPSSAISHTKGMTLRDYFANTALLGMFSEALLKLSDDVVKNTEKTRAEWFAEQSYDFADAMLKAREL